MMSLLILTTVLGCTSSPLAPESATVTQIVVTPDMVTSEAGRAARFTTLSLDLDGNPVPGAQVEWTSVDPSIAVVDSDGTVWSFSSGSTGVEAKTKGNGKSTAPGQVKKAAAVTVQTATQVRPDRVTDLAVEAEMDGTINLVFTEVDDGTGQPANYLFRFQVSPLSWSQAANVTFGSCGGQLSGISIGNRRVCSVSNLSNGTNYQFQVIAFRGSITQDPVYGDLSNIVGGSPASASEPPPTPAGLITRHTFDAPLEDGWILDRGDENYSNGVENGDGYGQAAYRTSLCKGCAPFQIRRSWGSDSEVDEVTVKLRWQLSPNFSHNTGSNNKKIFFLEASRTHPIILGTKDSNQTLRMYFATQRTAEPGGGARHINGGTIEPGRIYDIEVYVKLNSVDVNGDSNPDGIATVWVDGTRVIHATDMRYRGNDTYVSGETWEPADGISGIRWNPTWPHTGDQPAELMWERIYDIAVWSGSGG